MLLTSSDRPSRLRELAMDSFELNKIAGALLGVLLFAMSVHLLSGVIFSPTKPAIPGYDLPVPQEEAAAGAAPQAAAEPLPVLLAKADVGKGQASAKKCAACHTFEKGGPNKVGPNLLRRRRRSEGSYRELQLLGAPSRPRAATGASRNSTPSSTNPKAHIPGTIMAFAGIAPAGERADLLAYLRTLHDSPPPLPTP